MQLFCKTIIYKHINRTDQIYGYDNDNKNKINRVRQSSSCNPWNFTRNLFLQVTAEIVIKFHRLLDILCNITYISVNY